MADGKNITAKDVEFTYKIIQNPDTKSVLASSWSGVEIKAVSDYVVQFVLPQSLSSFVYSLTNGIVPKHLLNGIPPSRLRSISFNNSKPIGFGPFMWQKLEVKGFSSNNREESIALVPNPNYVGGKPKINGFIIRSFHNKEKLINSFINKELDAITGLTSVPDEIIDNNQQYKVNRINLTSSVMLFMKTSEGFLADTNILRKALNLAINKKQTINKLGYPIIAVDQPILKNQIGAMIIRLDSWIIILEKQIKFLIKLAG